MDETNGSHVTITPGEAVDDLARAHLWNKSELAILHEIVESGEPREIRIDGFVDLEIDKPAEFCECPTCKNKHCVEEPMYKVPEKLGHRIGEING